MSDMRIISAVLFAVVLTGCAGGLTTGTELPVVTSTTEAATTTARQPTEVVLMTHDSFLVSDEVMAAFLAETGIEVKVLQAGDAGEMVNQAVLTKDNPLADVIFGVDNTFLSRALTEGLFEPYASPLLDVVPDDLELDPEQRVTPIDFGDVCLNYDKGFFEQAGLAPPEKMAALTDPAYRRMLVVENPTTSSPGLAFLLSTIATFGETGDYTWMDYWKDLRENEVLIAGGWTEAYYSYFTAASDGDRPLVVSYASSPPFEVIFAPEPVDEAPTAVITDGCFRQTEFAGIVAGTPVRAAAGQLIDFMLSKTFQEDIPLNMYVFPANSDAAVPPEFLEYSVVPDDPVVMDVAEIESNRQRWLEQWTEVMTG